jgi:type II secretory pathway component GspD/PulD (secretin)
LNNNVSQQNINDVDTGIILGVTPRVTPEGIVVMEIDVTKSKLSDTEGVFCPLEVSMAAPSSSPISTSSTPVRRSAPAAARRWCSQA